MTVQLVGEDIAAVKQQIDYQHKWAPVVYALEKSSVDHCISCGRELGGWFGAFSWGIVNGEGKCANCGFPYRLYHRVEVEGVKATLTAFVPLADIEETPDEQNTKG